jgi:hypothetical protein
MEGKSESEILIEIENKSSSKNEEVVDEVTEDGLKSSIVRTPKTEKSCEMKDAQDKELEVLPSKQISETMEEAISGKQKTEKKTKDNQD